MHCTSDESAAIIAFLRKLSFKILRGDFLWIFSDKAIGLEASTFPEGSIGVQKAQRPGNGSMLQLYKGLLNDSAKLFVKGLERSLEGLSHSEKLKCLEGELFTTYKRRLYRYVIKIIMVVTAHRHCYDIVYCVPTLSRHCVDYVPTVGLYYFNSVPIVYR